MSDKKKKIFTQPIAPIIGNPNRDSLDFARRVTTKLEPWVRARYEARFANEGDFSHSALFYYHLRGDYFLGMTYEQPEYNPIGLQHPLTEFRKKAVLHPRLVNTPAFVPFLHATLTSSDLRSALMTQGTPYGLRDIGATGPMSEFSLTPVVANVNDPIGPEHFLIKEITGGTALTFFTMPELATMTYSLLPYVKDFHFGVMNYILEHSYELLRDSQIYRESAPVTTHAAVRSFNHSGNITGDYEELFIQLGLSQVDVDEGNDSSVLPSFDYICTLPLYYALSIYTELMATGLDEHHVMNDHDPSQFREYLKLLTIQAYIASKALSGICSEEGAGPHRYCKLDASKDRFTAIFQPFLQSYFGALQPKFPVGTIVKLNLNTDAAKKAISNIETHSKQSGLTSYLEAANQANNEFVVRAVTYTKKNKKITISYSLALTNDTAGVYGSTVRTGPLSPETDGVLNFVLLRDDESREDTRDIIEAPSGSLRHPINLIGRVFLSTVMHMAHSIAYVHKKRDMRFMSKGDGIGSYAPLTSNIDRKIHDGENQTDGVLDFYVAWRLEALASYLASLHSATSGAFRDQLVLFYESDMFANEFAYYSSVISNYISSQSVPEEQVEAVSGPRNVIKEPKEEATVTGSARLFYTKSVESETVYYRLDSSLLRVIYRDYVHIFYSWYTKLAQELDLGTRNLTTAGASPEGAIPMPPGKKAKKKPKYKRIQPTNAILKQMWPLVQARSVEAIESGAVRPDVLLRAIAEEVLVTRQRINLAVPLVPMSTSFIDFGALLSDPRTYALPPSTNATHVREFMVYLEGTFFSSYDLVGRLAARLDIVKTTSMTQDQLVKEFANRYKNFREVKVLNRFRWTASGHLIRLFREYSALPLAVRTELAADKTHEDLAPDAPEHTTQASESSTTAAPPRRIVPSRTQPVPLSIREEP